MKIENNRKKNDRCRPKVPVLFIIFTLFTLMLIAGMIHTAVSFRPRVRQIEMDFIDMQERLDDLWEGLNEIKQEVMP